jgi:hypothetical protein
MPVTERQRMRDAAAAGDGWRVPANPTPADKLPEDVAWLTARRVDMPLKCFEQELRLQEPLVLPRSYIYCTRIPPADLFGPFARPARTEPEWRCIDIDASHAAMLTVPDALMMLLVQRTG